MLMSRREAGRVVRSDRLQEIIPHTTREAERWLFVAPHDDDVVIGAGLLLQQAVTEGKGIKVLITTDGSMGYCDPAEQDSIVDIRRTECLDSFQKLGIEDVEWLDYPDAGLGRHTGRRKTSGDEWGEKAGETYPDPICGFSGLQNSYTYHLRTFRPSHVFVMSENDYNPDHKIVFQELLISLFHAQGAIWPELGPPLRNVPHVYEMAAYCNFTSDPTVEMAADAEEFERKLDAVDSYQSQKQIKILVENLRKNGPYEYIRDIDFDFYSPGRYRNLFQGDEGER